MNKDIYMFYDPVTGSMFSLGEYDHVMKVADSYMEKMAIYMRIMQQKRQEAALADLLK